VSLPVFQAACAVIIVLALAAMARRTAWGPLLRDYVALAVAGYLGEQSCISLYHFYRYSSLWTLRVIDVPLLVPLIWPLVVMSARSVGQTMWPSVRDPVQRATLVGAIVAFDASLVEVVAVRAGLWSWAEPGHLGVPVIGILGWGFFAAAADYVLGLKLKARHLLLLLIAPLTTHALIVTSWWALFRHTLRGELGKSSIESMVALGLLAFALVLRARRRGGSIPFAVALPRMIAASLFMALLLTSAPTDRNLWLHTAAVALPYLMATDFRLSA
jgi:hypothetical protein